MKIVVLGTRGIPNIQGGVETHCEQLYPRLVQLGCDITLITRRSYIENPSLLEFQGVKLKHVFAPRKKSIEAIIHTFLGILHAWKLQPDLVHIHAIGPSLMVPIAKLLGLKVVVTNHGPDYDRQKWGKLAKLVLKMGEHFGTRYADRVIVISNVIKTILSAKYGRNDCLLIYNGVNLPTRTKAVDYIQFLGLKPQNYMIAVGRFVEEKGFHDLIEAYNITSTDTHLVLVGDADHETPYSQILKDKARKNGVILTGFIKGEQLHQIFSHAKLFVMPSYHEGLPIALLEAMSYNLDVLVSDIAANKEVPLETPDYFQVGNCSDLSNQLTKKLVSHRIRDFTNLIKDQYDWQVITRQTYQAYSQIIV